MNNQGFMKKEIIIGTILIVLLLLLASYYLGRYQAQTDSLDNFRAPRASSQDATPTNTQGGQVNLTSQEVAKHNSAQDCWIIISDNVYAVTSYLNIHPGDASSIIPYCGTDATTAFLTQGGQGSHSQAAFGDLAHFILGSLNSQASVQAIDTLLASPPPTSLNANQGEDDDD